MSEEILLAVKELSERIYKLESATKTQSATADPIEVNELPSTELPPSSGLHDHIPCTATHASAQEIQNAFAQIKQAHATIRLPQELSIPTERSGIARTEQPLANFISKISKYAETLARIIQKGDSLQLEDISTVVIALISTLQEEQSALLVQGHFDPTVSKFFRTLQRGSGLSSEALEHLRTAATIASNYRPANRGRSGSGRGDWNRGDSNRGFRGAFRASFPRNRGGGRGSYPSQDTRQWGDE